MRSANREAKTPIDAALVCQELGRRIASYRKNSEMSQSDLGSSIGTSYQQIQKYEDGRNQVSVPRLLQIAKALNVTGHELLEGLSSCTLGV
jgi:transcriptional regulator with XRE-family HTH domain